MNFIVPTFILPAGAGTKTVPVYVHENMNSASRNE